MRLKDRIALITGAASGIGRATALTLAREGACIAVVDQDGAPGPALASELQDQGYEAEWIAADVSDSGQVEQAVTQCVSRFGGLDILVSNAGINPRGTVLTTSDELLDRILAVNLKALFYLCRYGVPAMRRRGGGSIVTVSSINGLVAWDNEAAYDASKGGVVMLTRALAVDHAPDNIRVNCICPGITDTPMLQRTAASKPDPEAFFEAARKMQPLNRLGQPEDIANAVLFLASDEAAYITAAILPVDGGYTAV